MRPGARRYSFPIHRHSRSRSRGSRLLGILLTLALAAILVVGGTVGMLGVAAVATVGALSTDLPDPDQLEDLTFAQPTVVYDRSGEVELGRFQRELRWVVGFEDVPKLVLDATTTAEDRTFWENDGYDPAAILQAIGENVSGESERGASTITQQLVRARLLPEQYVQPGADRYLRKAKELIQASRLTAAFPGESGKQQIITAYLNEIFYGHDAYGIAAAARVYFGVRDLNELSVAQAALLAALPKAPSTLDPYRWAEPDDEGRLVVRRDSPPIARRNYILRELATSRWTTLTPAQLDAALAEPVILSGQEPLVFRAPHFTWQVRRQLVDILGSSEAVDTGGYRVITTLDWKAQSFAEGWLEAAVIAPNLSRGRMERILDRLEIPGRDRGWIRALRGKDLHNAALVALDYRTGNVLAYAGSAGYYRDELASPKFEPKYDAAGDGARQPGSAFKPIVYATAFEQHRLTPGSLLLDITTEFDRRQEWAPRDADQLDRGPVLARKALQYSLNVPAIRALHRVGNEAVAAQAEQLGIRFHGGTTAYLQSGLAGAIGTVEVRPVDLTSAFGALGNGGVHVPPRTILEIQDSSGKVVWQAPEPEAKQAISPQSAYLVTDILEGNTDPRQNPIWAEKTMHTTGPDGSRRPAAVKTGTANEARDLATYGYLPPPKSDDLPGLTVGIWMGNSDHSNPRAKEPATSLTAAAPLWRAFVRDFTRKWPVTKFPVPDGIVEARIDAWSGGRPGPWTHNVRDELFLAGTQPGADGAIDRAGLLYTQACGGWRVDPLKAEVGPDEWDRDVADWLARARRGAGVEGPHESRTAYFWGESSWGGRLVGPCSRPKPPERERDKDDDEDRDRGGGGGGGGGGGRDKEPKPPKPPKPPGDDDGGTTAVTTDDGSVLLIGP